ncbi:MAG: NAD(+) synthase [Acidobacteria bacterium]|nr:NAD(+) synthase [Acidobacteriota bacterium]
MDKLNNLKISLCQMPVIAGRPDLNRDYIIKEIELACKKGSDIIVFPEMSVTGYIIGDLYDDEYFIKDAQRCNEQIRFSTKSGITAIWGNITLDIKNKGENGRPRKFNTALIAQNGQWLGYTYKTLQPNYRIFDDDRHFYSTRKVFEEELQNLSLEDKENSLIVQDYFLPFEIQTKIGEIKIGITLCEDMWCEDYSYNPTKYFVDNGAELIFNLSASPWSWQKNRKRHEIVKKLLSISKVPFVYVNNTNIQNTGKNLVVFDGSSTVYNSEGEIIFSIPAYEEGTKELTFSQSMLVASLAPPDDTKELYLALNTAIREYFKTLPPTHRKVIVGLSGGIDSALTLALYVDVLGKENVFAINMPSRFNSEATKNIAQKIATNLDVIYEIRPIQEIVDLIAEKTGVKENSPSYENIQARARMEILAARAQSLSAVFSSNWNKIEASFGYGTLYGDMAGFVAPIGDLVKREVYQLADYLNKTIYKKEVIPQECFEIAPTAELQENQQDPFDYGNLERRGYHDEMVRAFTDFRLNPEWFLEKYAQKTLEKELKLLPNTLKRLFPYTSDFIKDLEKHWQLFYGSYFKRIQSAPVPIVSKRAFGTDLRESILSAHFTSRYLELKRFLLSQERKIAIFGGSFNPVGKHHRQIAENLLPHFDLIIIVPCGIRTDKASVNAISLEHRRELVKRGFEGLEKIEFDFFDLDNDTYTPNYLLEKRYKERFPNQDIWYVIGGDIVTGGRDKKSEIHRIWQHGEEIWEKMNFLVIVRPGYLVEKTDLPIHSNVMEINDLYGSGSLIRELLAAGKPIDELVVASVAEYINQHKLYQK